RASPWYRLSSARPILRAPRRRRPSRLHAPIPGPPIRRLGRIGVGAPGPPIRRLGRIGVGAPTPSRRARRARARRRRRPRTSAAPPTRRWWRRRSPRRRRRRPARARGAARIVEEMPADVVFLEPCFPANQREFVRALHRVGARVTGIGERPKEALDDELRHWL